MIEFEEGGWKYRADRLSPLKQLPVGRRLLAVLGKMALANPALLRAVAFQPGGGVKFAPDFDWTSLIPGVIEGLMTLSDADTEIIVLTCLSAVSRQHSDTGGWQPLTTTSGASTVLMFQDLSLPSVLVIVQRVIQENLSGFFPQPPSGSNAPAGARG